MKSFFLCAALALVSMGCTGALGVEGTGGGTGSNDGGTSGTGGGTGTGGGSGGAVGDLPCDVATVIAARCASCHGSPVTGGAPMTLLSHADYAAASPSFPGQTMAQRSLARMLDGTMPPGGGIPAAQLDAFAVWVNAGAQVGSCGAIDAGSTEPTCLGGLSNYRQPTAANDYAGPGMAPGLACVACHKGQNFAGQNPDGLSKLNRVYQFMGTVFKAPHESNLCAPALNTSASIEIYNAAGVKVTTLNVQNPNGNFYGNAAGFTTGQPYTAKVVTSAGTRAMVGAQTDGDCNVCHTVAGASGAPGRIFLP